MELLNGYELVSGNNGRTAGFPKATYEGRSNLLSKTWIRGDAGCSKYNFSAMAPENHSTFA
jgi:hypothetical protein